MNLACQFLNQTRWNMEIDEIIKLKEYIGIKGSTDLRHELPLLLAKKIFELNEKIEKIEKLLEK